MDFTMDVELIYISNNKQNYPFLENKISAQQKDILSDSYFQGKKKVFIKLWVPCILESNVQSFVIFIILFSVDDR